MACDMCGKKGCELVKLRDCYQTDDVKDVCTDCCTVIDKHLSKLRMVTHNILVDTLRRFIGIRRKELQGEG